jgi:transposase
MRKGNVALRRCWSQAAWAISMMKNNYLSALYRRIAARRGAKRAVMAVAHALLVIAFHMLKRKDNYHELGADHFDRMDVNRIRRSLVRRLERLGHRVTQSRSLRPPEVDFRRRSHSSAIGPLGAASFSRS